MPSEQRPTPPGRLARIWAGLRLRDALLITFLPLVASLVMVGDSVLGYYRALQFSDWWSRGVTVAGQFRNRARALFYLPSRLVLRQGLNPDTKDAGVIRIDVPRYAWDAMEGDPQAMWGQWTRGARVRYGQTATGARLRKRGDNSVHWLTDKRSFTVRTSQEELYKGFRTFGLSTRDVVPSYLANRLAQEFDLLAPATQVVPVYLNNSYYGVFRFIEPVTEAFLRRVGQAPGNLFRGDRAERGDYMKSVPRRIFENPYLWERVDSAGRRVPAPPDQMGLLIRDMHGSEIGDHLRLMARHDRDEVGRLFAYLFFMGDPFHMDRIHNHFVYEDPFTQLLHPIPWDTRLLDWRNPQERNLNDWDQAVLADPFVVDAAVKEMARHLEGDALLKLADSLSGSLERRYPDQLRYDRLREGLVADIGRASEAMALLRGNAAVLRRWVDSSVVALGNGRALGSSATRQLGNGTTLGTRHSALGGAGAAVVIDAETRGFVGADLTALRVESGAGGTPVLRLDRNLNGVLDAADPAVRLVAEQSPNGLRWKPATPVALYAGWNTSGVAVKPGRFHYRFFVTGLPAAARVTLDLVNRVTGKPSTVVGWEAATLIEAATGFHPWLFPEPISRRTQWSGTVRLAETFRAGPLDTLIVAPGTTIVLSAGTSVVSRGLVLARGTADRPIRVIAADTSGPWGVVALQGSGASGSIFEHVDFSFGGRAVVDRIPYVGTINVHRADSVRFSNVVIRDNRRADYAFHGVHARGLVIRDSRFLNSFSDAIDWDESSGTIAGNTFERTGKNAIDLTMSAPVITDNRLSGSKDKGISIGEASAPFVFNNLIEHSGTGIEVRDRSAPIILHNDITSNRFGLSQFPRDWRYNGGGWATVINSVFDADSAPMGRDSVSRLTAVSAVGLDSIADPERVAPDLAWLYAKFGIGSAERKPGRIGSWTAISPAVPVLEGRFRDDFERDADGWIAFGGTTRLEKRRDALILEVERTAGGIRLPVSFELAKPGVLVIEVTGRDIERADLIAVADRQTQVDFSPGSDLARFRFVELPLPAGRYHEIRLEATPRPGLSHIQRSTGLSVVRAGRIDVRSFAVYPTPPAH